MLPGDIVILGIIVFLAVGFLWLSIVQIRENKHKKELLERARAAEIAEGITLLEGILAFFGDEGYWITAEDMTHVFVHRLETLVPSAVIIIHEPDQRIEVSDYTIVGRDGSIDHPEILIDLLIEAVEKQRALPKT